MEKKQVKKLSASHNMPQPSTPEEWESYRRRCEEAKQYPKVVKILPDGSKLMQFAPQFS